MAIPKDILDKMLVGETWKYITYDDPVEVSLWARKKPATKGMSANW